METTSSVFGFTSKGEQVDCIRLTHESGIVAEVLTYGATLRAVWVPTEKGMVQVCLGYETLQEYEAGEDYRGAIVGRCAGRIAGGKFSLNGKEYQLSQNQSGNHLHGGMEGFDRKIWEAEITPHSVVLSHTSPAGEEGYPGEVKIRVAYSFLQDGGLSIQFDAVAEQDTILSLTHHGYWNLAGEESQQGAEQLFSTPAECFAAIQPDGIPTGELPKTADSPFDFASPAVLKERLAQVHAQLAAGSGFDHTFLVPGAGMREMCRLYSPHSGITLRVEATLPGIHLYTGNFLQPPHCAIALEPQFVPDAPHHPAFPSVQLPGHGHWRHQIVYHFDI